MKVGFSPRTKKSLASHDHDRVDAMCTCCNRQKRRFGKSYSRASMKRSNLPNQKTATPANELVADIQPIEPDHKPSSQPAPSRKVPAVTALSATTTNARAVSSQ